MSHSLSSLRSHFFKHLEFYNRASTSFSFHRRFFISPSVAAGELQQQPSKLFTTTLNYSTLPLNNELTSPYLSVQICCPKHLSDALSESLMCFGANSTTIDEQDGRDYDEQEIWIGSTFDADEDVNDCISRAANSIGLKEIPNYKVEKQDQTDWIKLTQESFHPVEIIEGLWIVPEWRETPVRFQIHKYLEMLAIVSREKCTNKLSNYVLALTPPYELLSYSIYALKASKKDCQATNIILNPGLAFGTGEHPTTKLCLLLLHRLIKGGEYFLDYGTGSGVLAIAALKFGADISVGFDIEPQAITSARYNASLNNIGPDKLQLSLVSESPGYHISAEDSYNSKIIAERDKYDVVIANILLHPLLELADQIVTYAKPGATVGISGIICEQVPIVMERYSQLLEDINVSMMDDWACISGSKRALSN